MKNKLPKKENRVTPLMQQFFSIKEEYPDSLLFFQVGDFYELFFEDAKIASSFLAITLTKRGKSEGQDIPLCGVPVHALHHYLMKLVKGGFKVAIADQITKPVPGQIVERKVTRYITPGTILDEYLIDQKNPSYLCMIYPDDDAWGILFTELLSAQTFVTKIPRDAHRLLELELNRFFPDEIVISQSGHSNIETFLKQKGYVVSKASSNDVKDHDMQSWAQDSMPNRLHQQIIAEPVLLKTVYILHQYIKKNHALGKDHMQNLTVYEVDDYLILDAATQKNLDIIPTSGQKREHTLLGILDHAITAMGSRMIKKWLLRPLNNKTQIEQRQKLSFFLKQQFRLLQQARTSLSEIADIERIIGRIALQRAKPEDYSALTSSLAILPEMKDILHQCKETELAQLLTERIADFSVLTELLSASINNDSRQPWIIKPGFDFELDTLRSIVKNSQNLLLELEQEEIKKTGISALKLKYTDLYGYSFEATKNQSKSIPDYFILQQSLSNKNRYITEALKKLEQEITHADAQVETVEKKVFDKIASEVTAYISSLRHAAHALATFDAITSFAYVAYLRHYAMPTFNDENIIDIEAGRHPVVEQTTSTFVPNSTLFNKEAHVHIVTGPNMGGKSTYLRQVGLIHIMAHAGSLVPAKSANISLLDRLFTRIGSGDDLAQGKSTFLVEMEETAAICTQATEKSLVILDEVGRGTSTYDGMALAHAIIEFLAKEIKTRALFATHYHELTELENSCPGVINVHCDAQKRDNALIFLHNIKKGVSRGSFGIDIARFALLPQTIIDRAETVLLTFSDKKQKTNLTTNTAQTSQSIKEEHPVLKKINQINIDDLTPREALQFLYELKQETEIDTL
ncbi:DNA mismatch repair protein MutS [Candidatus Babeliales bacterium]|nr:DNA mismatch repair protein MutS [Candidatus Babeliales bacterium]